MTEDIIMVVLLCFVGMIYLMTVALGAHSLYMRWKARRTYQRLKRKGLLPRSEEGIAGRKEE